VLTCSVCGSRTDVVNVCTTSCTNGEPAEGTGASVASVNTVKGVGNILMSIVNETVDASLKVILNL